MSNGETPGIGGYPDLAKPETRVAQAWRHMWTRMLKDVPNQAHVARKQANLVRSTLAKRHR